jgi:hypothetical protein
MLHNTEWVSFTGKYYLTFSVSLTFLIKNITTPQGVKPNSLEEVTDLNLRKIIDMCLKQKAQDRYLLLCVV